MSSADIAYHLNIGVRDVTSYLAHVYAGPGIASRAAPVRGCSADAVAIIDTQRKRAISVPVLLRGAAEGGCVPNSTSGTSAPRWVKPLRRRR